VALPLGGARSWAPLQARAGPAAQPATSASGGQAVRELLRLVRNALQAFELLALPAGTLGRLPAPPRRRAGLGGPWALPPAGTCCCGSLQACTEQAPQPAASASP
jgi:hypothetical protein